jgi:Cu/Ag efflux protein CusF
MKKTHKALALVAAFSTALASAAVSPASAAGMSTQDWYHHVQTMRKKGEDHPWVKAKVKAINATSGEVTIAHAAIPHAKMPAMTMTFPVRDGADLKAHKIGDLVSIQAGEDGGVIKIVRIASSKR